MSAPPVTFKEPAPGKPRRGARAKRLPKRFCKAETKPLPGMQPLTVQQHDALKSILIPLHAEKERLSDEVSGLRARLALTERALQRYMSHAPGIDVDLGSEPLTEDDVAARNRLYRTANELLKMETPREMHNHVMSLSGQDAVYYDAWRRQYFLQCFAQQRDYHKLAQEIESELKLLHQQRGN